MSQPSGEQGQARDLSERVALAGRQLELADPDRGLAPADIVLNRIAEAIGVLILGAVVLIVFVNAVMRYLLNTSIIWAEEVVLGLIPWLAMVGLFLAIRRQTTIRIEYFFDSLPTPARHALLVLGHSWSAVLFAYLAWVALDYILLFGRDLTPYLGIPKGTFAAALVVGGLAALLAFALEAWRAAGRPKPTD